MAIQQGKNAVAERSCFEQNRWRRRSILPWRWSSKEDISALASSSSEDHAGKSEAAAISEALVQTRNPLSPTELHSLYAGTSVPPHRYLAPALIAALHSPAIALDPAKWFSGMDDVDFSSVAGDWLKTNGDTTFEQLKSVGLDLRASQLTAVVTIKQRYGYSGGPSTAGSQEYVAFWADWGAGFLYEGTATVVVYDCGGLPAAGQDYCLSLPVDLFLRADNGGNAMNPIRLRAVLSWNAPPSSTHPYAQAVWGNSLDRRMMISSLSEVKSGKESAVQSGHLRNHSALAFNAEDLEDRGPSSAQFRWNPAELIRDATSC
jgi:hypothetical protein